MSYFLENCESPRPLFLKDEMRRSNELNTRSEEAAAARSVQIATLMSALEQERRQSAFLQRQLEVREAEREARSALQSRIEELECVLQSQSASLRRAGEKICECDTRSEEAAAAQSVQIASVMSALEQERRLSARLQRQLESQSASLRRAEESASLASRENQASAEAQAARIAELESELELEEKAEAGAREVREAESEARSAALQSRIEELESTLHSKEEQIVCVGEKICECDTQSEEAAAARSVQIASVMSALEQERRLSARLQRQLESQSASLRRAEESASLASRENQASAEAQAARIAELESELELEEKAEAGAREVREAESEARSAALQSRIEELESALHSKEEQIVCVGEKICELNTRSEEAAAAQSVQIASVMSALEQERRLSARLQRQLEFTGVCLAAACPSNAPRDMDKGQVKCGIDGDNTHAAISQQITQQEIAAKDITKECETHNHGISGKGDKRPQKSQRGSTLDADGECTAAQELMESKACTHNLHATMKSEFVPHTEIRRRTKKLVEGDVVDIDWQEGEDSGRWLGTIVRRTAVGTPAKVEYFAEFCQRHKHWHQWAVAKQEDGEYDLPYRPITYKKMGVLSSSEAGAIEVTPRCSSMDDDEDSSLIEDPPSRCKCGGLIDEDGDCESAVCPYQTKK